MFGSWNGLDMVFTSLKWPDPKPELPEWERRPFALSPARYYTQPYPGTRRWAELQEMKKLAEAAKGDT